ncbi:MAG: tetratricopeptide repeat protein [Rikenellaceae bacterium]|nr:tetratricopeptide repeat protein [Rikenellaceae bacterium]
MKRSYLLTIILLLTVTISYAVSPEAPGRAGEHLDRGIELYEAKHYRAAMEELGKARRAAEYAPHQMVVKIDYYLACSAALTLDPMAMERLVAFLENYPGSIYENDIRFARANLLFDTGKYDEALKEYRLVIPTGFAMSERDEYHFKSGYSYFRLGGMNNNRTARQHFENVSADGTYGIHATYYTAYLDYVGGDYGAAKKVFQSLASSAAYGPVVPFYLLQIEFLEGNYDYVLREGDRLMESARGEREAEIARIMAESWFHKGDYGQALRYMDIYRQHGGKMGREENYIVGFSSYMRNDIADAESYLALVVGPDDRLTQNAAYHLAASYLRSGDKLRAMQSFSMAAGSGYDDTIREDALFNYGKLQYELGGGVFNEAINVLNRYIAEYPSGARTNEAWEFLVAAYYNSNNYEAAYEAISQVRHPDNNLRTALQKITYFRAMEFYSNGDYATALRLLDESLDNRFNPKYTALTQFWKGEILYREGRYVQAIPLFNEYLSLSPATEREYGMAQYNLGYCYFNLGRYGEARSWFDRFLRSSHASGSLKADAYNRVGDTYFTARDFARAVSNYESAAALGTPERYYAQYRKAVTLGFTSGNNAKIDALRAIVAAGEGNYIDEALYELGATYLAADRFNEAVTVLGQFTDRYPTSEKYLSALSNLGLAYQNLNNNQQALRYYQMVVDRAPSSAEARNAMIALKSIYVDMNDVDGYFNFAQRSGIETETGAQARDSLSYAAAERVYLSSAGDPARGIAAFTDYLDKFPRGVYRPHALYNLADLYARTDTGRAIATLEELAGMHYNQFTVRGLENLSALSYENGRYDKAADAYIKLAETAVNPQTVAAAWSGYLKSVAAGGSNDRMVEAADRVLAQGNITAEVRREALFSKARALSVMGQDAAAMEIYRGLATEVQSLEGAVSTYMVIESLYRSGQSDAAEKAVMDFAAGNTLHAYWLAKAFLVLGDIYIEKGDTFQARATLQSIVDGYSPADDGIIAEARAKIESL